MAVNRARESDLSTEDVQAEIARVLAKGYLRLLARKAAPVAEGRAEEALDDVGHKSVHGAGLTEGAP